MCVRQTTPPPPAGLRASLTFRHKSNGIDSALAISADLTGTGTLTILPASAATTIGVAGGTGTLTISTADLN